MKYLVDYEIVEYDTYYIYPSGLKVKGPIFHSEEKAVEHTINHRKEFPATECYFLKIEHATINEMKEAISE